MLWNSWKNVLAPDRRMLKKGNTKNTYGTYLIIYVNKNIIYRSITFSYNKLALR